MLVVCCSFCPNYFLNVNLCVYPEDGSRRSESEDFIVGLVPLEFEERRPWTVAVLENRWVDFRVGSVLAKRKGSVFLFCFCIKDPFLPLVVLAGTTIPHASNVGCNWSMHQICSN